MSRPLDRSRPLWEMYLIEGLEDGGFAILTKSHRCLIDGGGAEMSELICDDEPDVAPLPVDVWMPGPPPGTTSLAVSALAEALARPGELIDSVIGGNGLLGEARSVVVGTVRRAGRLVQQLTDSAPSSLLNAPGSSTRTFVSASVPRRDVAKIAERNECTVNDVELAIITGASTGIGFELASLAAKDGYDIVVAAESAYFLQAFRRIGLVPDGGSTYLLPRLIGKARAMEMALLGEKVPAAKALEWGLINRVVPDAELMTAARGIAEELARGPRSMTDRALAR